MYEADGIMECEADEQPGGDRLRHRGLAGSGPAGLSQREVDANTTCQSAALLILEHDLTNEVDLAPKVRFFVTRMMYPP